MRSSWTIRRNALKTNEAEVDSWVHFPAQEAVTYLDFINKELVQFAKYDVSWHERHLLCLRPSPPALFSITPESPKRGTGSIPQCRMDVPVLGSCCSCSSRLAGPAFAVVL